MNEVAKGAARGFGGCFGMLAACIVLLALLYTCGSFNQPRQEPPRRSAEAELPAAMAAAPEAFCDSAFAEARRVTPRALRGHALSPRPPLRPAPTELPDRVACFSTTADRIGAQFTFDVRCADPNNAACIRLVSVVTPAGPAFIDEDAANEAFAD